MRILFAAGTQFPFPRMDRVVQGVAEQRLTWTLVYQAGPDADLSTLGSLPNLRVQPLFKAEEYQQLFVEAELVVTHAGMGNILACLEQGKPFLMMPRLARLGEHRNDHQVDTAEAIASIYHLPFYEEVDSLIEAVLEYDGAAPQTVTPGESIRSQRRDFGKKLNALIRTL
ncbi:glycosyltransferase [Halomonas mongoliensis]|uniref:glycosyltransferase n=1 Tax=Halomonas mongoliensis TaxID=321265 RepID=UPI00403AF833